MELELTSLIWDEFNITHITKHGVSVEEVETACRSYIYVDTTYGGRYLLVGRTNSGRLISIVLTQIDNQYYIITARDSSRGERKKVYDLENQ